MATKTLGLTGRDYSTLAAWATYVNALSLSANEILEVYNDGGAVSDTASVTVAGWTANGFSVTMRPASGQGIKDNANKLTNALRWNASNGAALTNSVGYDHAYVLNGTNLVVQDLQFRATASSASSVAQVGGGAVVSRSIFYRSAGTAGHVLVQAVSAATVNDSLIIHNNGSCVQAINTDLVLGNCTLASIGGGGHGIRQPYAVAPVVKNCVLYNFTTDVEGTAGGGTTNNATSKATFGGTGWSTNGQTSVTSADFENVSAGTEDFRIATGSTKLINTGASGVGSGSDIVATGRGGTYDIGAWEAAGDDIAPTLSSATGTGSTLTSAGGVTTDEASGTLYMVTTASATAPTKAQVKAGQDHTGVAALRVSSVAVSSTGAKTFSAASCTAGTRYNHYMHEDAAANQSNVVSSASFVVGSGVTFSGTVPAQSGVTGTSFSLDLSTYFSGNMTRTYAVQSGSLTSSGLSLNASSGIVSGTLATVGAYSISVRATDTYSDTDDTNSFTITVSSTGTAPTVSTHPSNTTVTAGATASFTAAAGGSPTPTVQWQENTGSWSNISGQTTTTLSLGVVGTPDNGRQFRAVFTNSSGSATTNTATLTVNAASGDGTITSEPLKNNMGQLLGANTLSWLGFRNATTGADVLLLTGVSVNSSSIFSTTNAALAPGQLYAINWKTSDGKYGYAWANAV